MSLSKLTVNFDEEIDKTQNILKDLFGKLRDLVNEREIELKNELEKLKTHGSMILNFLLSPPPSLYFLNL